MASRCAEGENRVTEEATEAHASHQSKLNEVTFGQRTCIEG